MEETKRNKISEKYKNFRRESKALFSRNKSDDNSGSTKEIQKGKKKIEKKKIFAIAMFAIITIICSTFFPFSKEPEKIDYVVFVEQLEKGEIEEIKINSGKGKIRYEIGKDSYYTNYPYSETFIEDTLLKGVNVEYETDTSIKNLLGPISSIFSILLALFFIKFITKQMGPGEASYKNIPKETKSAPKTTSFSDIAGMDEIKEDMRSLAEIIKNKEYKEKGVVVPKGVLLDGPPGNGKTLLARAFANECGLNFIALNASDFSSPFVGVATQKINKAFHDAKEMAPCVIFIDEIDAIGSRRTSAASGAEKEFNSSLTALLGNMDGFTSNDDVLVMAATNKAEHLDDALVRPGRFDRKFTIGLPDKKTRQELFTLYTKNMKLAEDVSIDNLVSRTYGCSSAQVKNVVNEALINSITNKRDCVTSEDFSSALVRMTLNGVEKKKDRWEGKTKDIVAYHEAGHAVMAYLLGRNVSSISIIPTTASAGGYTMLDEGDEDLKNLSDYKNTIMVLYGGRAAESLRARDVNNISMGASHDIKQATRIASSFVNFVDGIDYSAFGEHGIEIVAEKAKTELDLRWRECLAKMAENWEMVEMVAEALKVKEKVSAEEFLEIVTKLQKGQASGVCKPQSQN